MHFATFGRYFTKKIMGNKIDSKTILIKLEFVARAAEDFRKAYTLLKSEVEEITPVSAYAKRKQAQETKCQEIGLMLAQQSKRSEESRVMRINAVMKSENLSWNDAVALMSKRHDDIMRAMYLKRKEKAGTKK